MKPPHTATQQHTSTPRPPLLSLPYRNIASPSSPRPPPTVDHPFQPKSTAGNAIQCRAFRAILFVRPGVVSVMSKKLTCKKSLRMREARRLRQRICTASRVGGPRTVKASSWLSWPHVRRDREGCSQHLVPAEKLHHEVMALSPDPCFGATHGRVRGR